MVAAAKTQACRVESEQGSDQQEAGGGQVPFDTEQGRSDWTGTHPLLPERRQDRAQRSQGWRKQAWAAGLQLHHLGRPSPARPSASSQVWIPDHGHHKGMWFPAATAQRLRQVEGPRWREQLGSLRLETVLSPLRDLGLSPEEPPLLGPGHW